MHWFSLQGKGATMKKLLAAVVAGMALAVPSVLLSAAADQDKPNAKKVDFEVYNSYSESNKSGLKGAQSFLAFTKAKAFNKTFGKAVVMGKKRKFLADDAFDSKIVVATIKRGGDIWTYQVDKVTAADGKLIVHYKATGKDGGTARYASPLIIAVDKAKYSSVVFIENGKKAGTATIKK
jgi:hypothetical protein